MKKSRSSRQFLVSLLVLVHGFTCTREDRRFQVAYFRSPHRAVSPDLRGLGLSSYQDPLTCTVKNYGSDVKALLEALSPYWCTGFIGDHVRVPLQPGEITPWMDLVRRHVHQAKFEIITGVGHFIMLEAPNPVNQALALFLASLS